MAWKVFVDGQEGTTGLRIHEVLATRPDVQMLHIEAQHRKDSARRAQLLNAADVAFLCLPDEAARESAALVTNPNTCVIDASTAHRTHAQWVYGLPELCSTQRQALRQTKRIANPGCHATAFILLMRPLIDAGLIAADTRLSATSVSGYSGGGRKLIEQYQAGGDPALLAPRPYGLTLKHKHLPEMMAHTGLRVAPVFMPIVAGYYKGLAVQVPLHCSQLQGGADAAAVHRALSQRYAHERFVRVAPLGDAANLRDGFFEVQACNDTNRAELFVFANADQMVLMAREDNLGKGASGAAIQCMNVHLGCDEGLGLT